MTHGISAADPEAAPDPMLLKQDLFGTVRRGVRPDGGAVVIRDLRGARWWLRPLARHLARREVAALRRLAGIRGLPELHECGPQRITRSWIEGAPMQLARPRDPAYFRDALRLLRQIHARKVLHNDLAKEPNWLVTPAGLAAVVDFQLAHCARRRGAIFRALGHDDLRHLLKHKRTYLPERLTQRQRRVLATRSLPSRIWMATGKRAYRFITRSVLRWSDREGAGDRQL